MFHKYLTHPPSVITDLDSYLNVLHKSFVVRRPTYLLFPSLPLSTRKGECRYINRAAAISYQFHCSLHTPVTSY